MPIASTRRRKRQGTSLPLPLTLVRFAAQAHKGGEDHRRLMNQNRTRTAPYSTCTVSFGLTVPGSRKFAYCVAAVPFMKSL